MKTTDELVGSGSHTEEAGALDQLLSEVTGLRSRESIIQLCEATIRLRHLAPFNAMLVYMQKPDATRVHGAVEWRAFGRSPKPGIHPLVILQPFGPVAFVYDVGDTDGEALEEQLGIGNMDGDAFGAEGAMPRERLFEYFDRCERLSIKVVERSEKLMKAGHVRRFASDAFEIELNVDHQPEQKFCSLCHELAHIFCGHLGRLEGFVEERLDGSTDQETEAELSAYLAARRGGITPNSGEYLKWYVASGDVPRFSLDTVLVAVGRIEALLRGDLRRKKHGTT